MISRCPGCGSQVAEEETCCVSCGWDFGARKVSSAPENPPGPVPSRDPLESVAQVAENSKSDPASVPDFEALVDPLAGLEHESETQREIDAAPAQAAPPFLPSIPAVVSGKGRARKSSVSAAALFGAALGAVGVLAVYFLLRSGAAPPQAPAVAAPVVLNQSGPSPKAISASAPGEPPATSQVPLPAKPLPEAGARRPTANFASAPRVVVAAREAASVNPALVRTPESAPSRPKGVWKFEGEVFDATTARGVFAAKLVFLNSAGNQVGTTETGPSGRYKIRLPALSSGGYAMKITHQDYVQRYIDEGNAISALREATPEERKILLSAASRNPPWVGDAKTVTRRDLALVSRSSD